MPSLRAAKACDDRTPLRRWNVGSWHISEELIRRGNVRLLVESGRPSERKRTNKRRGMRSEQDNAGESSQSLDGIGSDNGMLSEVILPPARQELAAGWVHCRELSAAEQKNSSRESPMPTDPGANRRRIGFRDDPRCLGSRILPSMSINSDRGVKTQHGLTRDANPIAWNDTEDQRAGR